MLPYNYGFRVLSVVLLAHTRAHLVFVITEPSTESTGLGGRVVLLLFLSTLVDSICSYYRDCKFQESLIYRLYLWVPLGRSTSHCNLDLLFQLMITAHEYYLNNSLIVLFGFLFSWGCLVKKNDKGQESREVWSTQELSCRDIITHDIFIMPKAESFCSKSCFFDIIITFIYFTASSALNHRLGEATGNPGYVLKDWESLLGPMK